VLRDEALEHAAAVEWPYRHRIVPGHRRPGSSTPNEVPCASSVVVWIGADGTIDIEPRAGGAHEAFVRGVRLAQCVQVGQLDNGHR
jgi:hypothetical protein